MLVTATKKLNYNKHQIDPKSRKNKQINKKGKGLQYNNNNRNNAALIP